MATGMGTRGEVLSGASHGDAERVEETLPGIRQCEAARIGERDELWNGTPDLDVALPDGTRLDNHHGCALEVDMTFDGVLDAVAEAVAGTGSLIGWVDLDRAPR